MQPLGEGGPNKNFHQAPLVGAVRNLSEGIDTASSRLWCWSSTLHTHNLTPSSARKGGKDNKEGKASERIPASQVDTEYRYPYNISYDRKKVKTTETHNGRSNCYPNSSHASCNVRSRFRKVNHNEQRHRTALSAFEFQRADAPVQFCC